MRLVRFRTDDRIATGVLQDEVVRVLGGTFFESPVPTGEELVLGEVRLLAPVLPSKMVGIARNYPEHARELGNEIPPAPLLFIKPATSVLGPGDAIPVPQASERVDHEAELAVVIGRLCRRVPEDEVRRVILGFTCANDVTARDWQRSDGQWARAKGSDGFGPIGPWIETELDTSDLEVTSTVNGELRQKGRTSDMVHTPASLISYISRTITLLPGDVVLTGTPPGVGPLVPGDRVEVEVEGVGVLRNEVVAA